MTHPVIRNMAREFAGVFYDQDRSALFRSVWPKQDEYVERKWMHFVRPAREIASQMLGDPAVPESEKEKLYEAILSENKSASSPDAKDMVQLAPNSLQYRGDPFENRMTAKNFASGDSNHAALMRSAAKFRI